MSRKHRRPPHRPVAIDREPDAVDLTPEETDAAEKGLIPWDVEGLGAAIDMAEQALGKAVVADGEDVRLSSGLPPTLEAISKIVAYVSETYADQGLATVNAHLRRFVTVQCFINRYRSDLALMGFIVNDPDDPESSSLSPHLVEALAVAPFDAQVLIDGQMVRMPVLARVAAEARSLRAEADKVRAEMVDTVRTALKQLTAAQAEPAPTWAAETPEASRGIARGLVPWTGDQLLYAIGVAQYLDAAYSRQTDLMIKGAQERAMPDLPVEYRKIKYLGLLIVMAVRRDEDINAAKAHWYRAVMADAFVEKHLSALIEKHLVSFRPGKPPRLHITSPLLHALATLPFTQELPGTDGVAFTFSYDDVLQAIPLADRRRQT